MPQLAYSKVENSRGEMQPTDIDLTYVDFGYLEQYKMKLLAGRFFDKNIVTDTMQAMILNKRPSHYLATRRPRNPLANASSNGEKKG